MKTIYLLLTFITLNFSKIYAQCDSVYTWIQFTTGDYDESTEKCVVKYSSTGKILSSTNYIVRYPDFRWQNYKRELYTYDSNDSLLHDLVQTGSDTNWTNSFQKLYTYDSYGNNTIKKQQNWSNNAWVDFITDSFTFDNFNHTLSHTITTTLSYRTLYSYNSLGQDTTEITQNYDTSSGWINTGRTDFYYNANGLKDFTILFGWISSAWDTTSRTLYTYSGIDNDSMIIQYDDTNWVNQNLTLYDYSPFHQIIHTYQLYWQDTAWFYTSELINEVDQYGYPSYHIELGAYYDGDGNLSWQNNSEATYYSYDSLGRILSYNFDPSAGGPYDGSYAYDAFGIISSHTHYESMGGMYSDRDTYYYYADIIGDTVICNGSSTTLSLDSCTGYTYLWSTGDTTASITVSSPGFYSATVDHGNGFVAHTPEVRLQVVNGLPYIPAGTDSTYSICNNRSLLLQIPNQSNTHFQWFRNDSILLNQTNSSLSAYSYQMISGEYYLVAYNACGADTSARTNVILKQAPLAPTITTSGPTTICVGDSLTLTSSIGTNYYWYPDGQNTQSITVGISGNYRATVYDTTGCQSSATSTYVTIRPYPPVPIHVYFGNGGIISNYTATAQWFLNGDSIPGATGWVIYPTLPGYYSHTSALYLPCFSHSDSVYYDPAVLSIDAGPDRYACLNNPTYIGNYLAAVGGTPPYTYSWTVNPHLTNLGSGTARIDSVLTDAVYYLTVRDSMGLIATDSMHVYIDHPVVPLLSLGGQKPFCKNEYNTIRINNFGMNYSVLNWYINGDSIANTSTYFNYRNSGIYQVAISDQYGCKVLSEPDTIQMFDSYPTPVIHGTLDSNACVSGIGTLWVNYESGSTYSWVTLPNQVISTDTLTNISYPNYYQVTVTDSNNCAETSSLEFDSFNENIDCQLQLSNYLICADDTLIAQAPIFTGWNYDWYRDDVSLGINSPTLYITLPGSYKFEATSPDGCSASSNSYPMQSWTPINITIQIAAGVLQSDTTGNFNYQWFLNGQEIPGALASTYTPTVAGTYTLRINDFHRCDMFSNTITFGPCEAFINPLTDVLCDTICSGELEATGAGIGPIEYLWSTGETTSYIGNLCGGYYTVRITDSLGCFATDGILITQDSISISLQHTNPSCIGCSDGTIQFNVLDGIPPYQYTCQPSVGIFTGDSIINLPAGIYLVCATDINGCMTCANDTLTDPPAGISQLKLESFTIYPNPVTNEFILKYSGKSSSLNLEIIMYDSEGRSVYVNPELNTRYNATNLPAGVYTLKIITVDSIQYLKFVKQ
ncbi:MAG: T9SS type A sorting domain-containing protein [Bacteroidetes bacterium]|nr:T9SS type A sorting domain-containing protein [Bacteroidota bacterium]